MMSLPEEDRFEWREIFELFHKPEVLDAEFKFDGIDEDKIREILVVKHNFSEERVNNQLGKLKKIKDESKQKGLGDWV